MNFLKSDCLRITSLGLPCCCCCYAKSLQLCPTLCDPIDGSLSVVKNLPVKAGDMGSIPGLGRPDTPQGY